MNYRHAEAGGWFSDDLAVEQGAENYPFVKHFSGDAGQRFTLLVNGTVLDNQHREMNGTGGRPDA